MKNPFKTDLPEFLEWVDPEQERKDNKNAKIVGWGLALGTALLLLFRNETGFILFFASFGGSFLFLED
jgi:hypothetical protein